jgi:hypothetical protein
MVRRALALFGALSLVLSPGAVGLLRAFASLDACGCNMGADCPMCKARRAHEKKGAGCPCQLQRQAPTGEQAQGEAPSPDPIAVADVLTPPAAATRTWASLPRAFLSSWFPPVETPPPRAAQVA